MGAHLNVACHFKWNLIFEFFLHHSTMDIEIYLFCMQSVNNYGYVETKPHNRVIRTNNTVCLVHILNWLWCLAACCISNMQQQLFSFFLLPKPRWSCLTTAASYSNAEREWKGCFCWYWRNIVSFLVVLFFFWFICCMLLILFNENQSRIFKERKKKKDPVLYVVYLTSSTCSLPDIIIPIADRFGLDPGTSFPHPYTGLGMHHLNTNHVLVLKGLSIPVKH